MGPDVSGPELVAAVSNGGNLGIMQAQLHPPPLLRQAIRRVRQLTDKPFWLNFLLHFPCEEGVTVCVEERVPVVSFFWGNPASYIARVHAVGGKVCHQVGFVLAAQEAARAGVDVIIAQGVEAGGHLAGEVTTMVLVPRVVDTVGPTPVVEGKAEAAVVAAFPATGGAGVSEGILSRDPMKQSKPC